MLMCKHPFVPCHHSPLAAILQAIESPSTGQQPSPHALEAGLNNQPPGSLPDEPLKKDTALQDGPGQPPKQQQQLFPAWKQQFVDAIEYDSKAAEEGEEPGGVMGLVMHFMSIFWKLVLATVPPPWWAGGWPCFWASLVWIIAQVGRGKGVESEFGDIVLRGPCGGGHLVCLVAGHTTCSLTGRGCKAGQKAYNMRVVGHGVTVGKCN